MLDMSHSPRRSRGDSLVAFFIVMSFPILGLLVGQR